MKYHWKVLTMLLAVGLIMASCTKKNSSSNVNSNVSQHNEDVSNSTTESNNVNTDVNTALTQTSIFGKNFSAQSSLYICGATIDSSGLDSVQPFIVITYTGSSSCSSTEIRSGQIRVQLISGSHWVDAGAVVQLTFINYKVVYPYLNNHSLTFNGIKYLTDVTGINELQYILNGGSTTATFRERSYNMLVTFDNGQTSSWNSARHTDWTVSSYTTFTGTVYGDTTINGLSNIDSWGKTRFNTNFTTQMIQPWQSGTTCGWWQPTQGNYTSVTDSFTVSALLGVNSAGNQVSSGCAWGLKLTWTLDGYNGTALVQYW